MQTLPQKNLPLFDSATVPILSSSKGVRFQRTVLVDELLSLGHAKITRQIAELVAQEVEKEIEGRKVKFLTSELVSDLVASKLEELGLIRSAGGTSLKTAEPGEREKDRELSNDVLKFLAVPDAAIGRVAEGVPAKKSKEALALPLEGIDFLQKAFCVCDEEGNPVEKPEELLSRVARAVAEGDTRYNPMATLSVREIEFYNLMARGFFIPNATALRHAGRAMGVLSPSFVLPVHDSTESIFETMKQAAILHRHGVSAGFSFTHLRPRKDRVRSVRGASSGPVAFMKVFQTAMETYLLDRPHVDPDRGFLNISHPDVLDFMEWREGNSGRPMHLSLGVTDAFMKGIEEDAVFPLINPRTGEAVEEIGARKVFKQLVRQIHQTASPSLLFLGSVEAANPLPKQGPLLAATAQGDEPLLPFETFPSGALNLAAFCKEGEIDWGHLKNVILGSVAFLENMVEINYYPFPETAEMNRKNRKIGLGVMGWGSLLSQLGISYASEAACLLAERVMTFIQKEAEEASSVLAVRRGPFAHHAASIFDENRAKRRHAVVTALCSTAEISRLAGVSPGIEPVLDEKVSFEWHLRMQSAFQKHTENGVFKKFSLTSATTEADVAAMIILAHRLGLKSLIFEKTKEIDESAEIPEVTVEENPPEISLANLGNCSFCGVTLAVQDETLTCPSCGPVSLE